MPTLPRHNAPRPWIVPMKPHENSKGRDEHQRFYHSKVWQALRLMILQRDPLCVVCKTKGIIIQSTIVDHIKPLIAGGDLLDPDNLQGMCKECHDKKSAKERWMQHTDNESNGGGASNPQA